MGSTEIHSVFRETEPVSSRSRTAVLDRRVCSALVSIGEYGPGSCMYLGTVANRDGIDGLSNV